MVIKLTHEEILKVCGTCKKFNKNQEMCLGDTGVENKPLKEVHRCSSWDSFFGGSCIYQGNN